MAVVGDCQTTRLRLALSPEKEVSYIRARGKSSGRDQPERASVRFPGDIDETGR